MPLGRKAGVAWLTAVLVWLLAALAPAAWAEAPVPALTGRVVDTTGSLPAEAVARIERQLAELETATGAQAAVLMVGTTDGEPIEGYAVRVFEDWKLGRKGVDDGVLLVVAREDRALRIEVGYGLEGAITDAKSSRLIREQITPHFAQGDFAGGIQAGVDGLSALIRQEPLPPPATPAGQDEDEDMWYGLFFLALIALFAHPVVLTVVGAALGWALLPGWGAWLGALVGGGLGALVGVVLSVTGIRQAIRKASRKGGGPGGPGGWGGGRGGGGWGGGGGFGGGGGRSGGGGASGRW